MTTTTGHRTISHRELRNNSGEILRAVVAGESFTITNNGQPVAELVPAGRPPFGGLTVTQARQPGDFSSIPKWDLSQPVLEILDELRGER